MKCSDGGWPDYRAALPHRFLIYPFTFRSAAVSARKRSV